MRLFKCAIYVGILLVGNTRTCQQSQYQGNLTTSIMRLFKCAIYVGILLVRNTRSCQQSQYQGILKRHILKAFIFSR